MSVPLELAGVGLHTGQQGVVRLLPAEVDSGICILLRGAVEPFRANSSACSDTARCTTLEGVGGSVMTVEHVLSALLGCGVDNCLLEVDGPEIPALDGSARPFVDAILDGGMVAQDAARRVLVLNEPVWVHSNSSHLLAIPAPEFKITYGIDFAHPVLGKQIYSGSISPVSYRAEIAGARTFGFLSEVQQLLERGLARGGSKENALVITDDGFLTPQRFNDEPVRHKVLDLIGDLALIGSPLQAEVIGIKTSHSLNVELARAILAKRRD